MDCHAGVIPREREGGQHRHEVGPCVYREREGPQAFPSIEDAEEEGRAHACYVVEDLRGAANNDGSASSLFPVYTKNTLPSSARKLIFDFVVAGDFPLMRKH